MHPIWPELRDRVVKAPLIVANEEDDPKQPTRDPENITKDNVADKYGTRSSAPTIAKASTRRALRPPGTRPDSILQM
jgi:hypothetical protein